jgi:hypothetical protein
MRQFWWNRQLEEDWKGLIENVQYHGYTAIGVNVGGTL